MKLPHTKTCKRCKKPTGRHVAADYCWECKPIVEKENRYKREHKTEEITPTNDRTTKH